MKTRVLKFAALAIAAGVSTVALAGAKTTQQVLIRPDADGSGFAVGDLGYVRNTPDIIQWIGCSIGHAGATCTAKDITGLTKSCFTSDPAKMAVARAVNGDSFILFYWDPDGSCRFITLWSNSMTAPK